MTFAKLFDTDRGHVLVKKDEADGPENECEVRLYCEPPEMGVCSIALKWPANDVGWLLADRCFDGMTAEKALIILQRLFDITDDTKEPRA